MTKIKSSIVVNDVRYVLTTNGKLFFNNGIKWNPCFKKHIVDWIGANNDTLELIDIEGILYQFGAGEFKEICRFSDLANE